MTNKIIIGDKVRSFDFGDRDLEGKRACYIEGIVEAIGKFLDFQSCEVYKDKCTKKDFGGEVRENHEEHYYPPKNGTTMMIGGKCDFVTKI